MANSPKSTSAAPVLGCRAISKRFGETQALSGVSVDFRAGCVHSVLGENGSGKSTLAKAVCGILSVDEGAIVTTEGPLSSSAQAAISPRMMLSHGVAIVLQEVLVVPNRSVADNIMLGQEGLLRGRLPRDEKNDIARDILARLTDRDIPMDALAGGLPLHEQQLIVIARGFASRPRVLILDESTAPLDLADRAKLFKALKSYCAEGGCVIFVSHRMVEIIELSDHVHIMRNGHLIAELSGDEITPEHLLEHLTQEGADA